jgi:hypothetical protein
MLQRSGSELSWRFEGGAEVRFPVATWVRLGERQAALDGIALDGSTATATYEGGRLTLRLACALDPATGALVQTVELTTAAPAPGLLLDVRAVPVLPDPLDWLTVPGLFYGDNDLTSDRVEYPRGMARDWCSRADGSPCPGVHLAGASRGHAAFLERDRAEIAGVPTGVEGHWDVVGVGWTHQDGARAARFTVPAQEEPQTYRSAEVLFGPTVPRLHAPAGARVRFRIHHFVTPGGRAGYHRAARAMAVRGRPAALDPGRARIAGTARLFAGCMRDAHFWPGVGFQHRNDLKEVHSGWSGGLAAAEAGLVWGAAAPDSLLFHQAEEMGDFICGTGLSPLGYFMAEYREEPERSGQYRWCPHVYWGKAKGLHVRHAAEGSLFLARLLRREAAAGRARPAWRKALYANLEAAARDQRDDGALPIELDPATGQVLDWEGSTPGTWAGTLAMGAALAEQDGDAARARRWRDAAERAAAHYAERYVHAERFFGGPYDAHRAPNMEDAYLLLIAFAELYRATEDGRWLAATRACADHLLAWRYTYDVEMPPGTICRQQGVSTYGTSPASARNRHLQNWDTVAALPLADLSAWTGDPGYRQAAVDHLVQSCQLVERGDGALGIPLGGQSEQWYATEFHWFGSFGHYAKGNLWKVSVVLPKAGFLTAAALLGPFE